MGHRIKITPHRHEYRGNKGLIINDCGRVVINVILSQKIVISVSEISLKYATTIPYYFERDKNVHKKCAHKCVLLYYYNASLHIHVSPF